MICCWCHIHPAIDHRSSGEEERALHGWLEIHGSCLCATWFQTLAAPFCLSFHFGTNSADRESFSFGSFLRMMATFLSRQMNSMNRTIVLWQSCFASPLKRSWSFFLSPAAPMDSHAALFYLKASSPHWVNANTLQQMYTSFGCSSSLHHLAASLGVCCGASGSDVSEGIALCAWRDF